MVDRKDLLMNEVDKPSRKLDIETLSKNVNEGSALLNMKETFGWKLLYEKFIEPRVNQNRYLMASKDDLIETRAAMRELNEMLSFIDNRIKEGITSFEKLNPNA
jgi:hypothetical protein